jgi:hypothetical protein
MISLTLTLRPDEARHAQRDLKDILTTLSNRIATNAPERVAEDSTRAYVVLRDILTRIQSASSTQDVLIRALEGVE